MFSVKIDTEYEVERTQSSPSTPIAPSQKEMKELNKYNYIPHSNSSSTLYSTNSLSSENIDKILEKEKLHNKTETWNKLDKTQKIQKLHAYAEKYGKDNKLTHSDLKSLKVFFIDCLEKNKLQKSKDVNYDKEKQEITSIPSLFFSSINRNFTLKITDPKRVSTLKSLTPRKKEIKMEEE